jgi:hypothetical protein
MNGHALIQALVMRNASESDLIVDDRPHHGEIHLSAR